MIDRNLLRPFELKDITPQGKIAGYGSVFHVEDHYSDIVMPGAFARSLRERAAPKMLWQHNPTEPIGVWNVAKEDEKGLYLEGELVLGVPMADAAFKLMRAGALDGLSIGYSTKRAEFDEKKGVRKLLDVELYEVSPVTFPANEAARIESVKARKGCDPHNIRELEAILRDAGLSRTEAKALLADGFKAVKANALRDAVADDGEFYRELRAIAAAINP